MTSKIDVFEAELDPSTGQVIKKAEKSIKKYVGLNGTPNYSNDGNFIAYVSKRSSGTMKFTTNHIGNVLCVKSLITGEETELRPNIKLFGWPRWSSDDKSVMVVSLNKGYSYYQIDTQTGNTKPLFLTQARNLYGGHHLCKDYKTIYYGIRDSLTKEYKLVERDINKQTEKVLYKSEGKIGISMSPNEEYIAIVSDLEKCLKLIPVGGGVYRELLSSEVLNKFDLATWGVQIAWSHDNKYIYFVIVELKDEKGQLEICRTSVEKGTFERTGLVSDNQFANLSIHPDGRRITFSARGESNSEVWAMENFLPLDKLAQNKETETAKEPEGIRIRQISKKPFLDDFGTVSRDGRYLSFVDWEDGELAILDLNTGEKRILTKNATLDENPEKFVIGSAISKNGKKVAYSWWRPYHTFDLHIFDIEKNSDKLLYKEDKVEAYPVAWRTDNEIIVIRRDGNKELSQVTLFNVLDGTFQELKTGWPGLCVSPDGNFLAYSTKKDGQSNSDIYLLTIDKKDEVPLIVHPANDKVIGWIPNRAEFLFISDRAGTWDLWSIQIINGKPSGEPRRLFSEIGEVEPVGITEKGECFIGFRKRNFNAYILPVNKLTGNPEGNPEIPLSGSIYSKNWSPDGKYMVRAQEGRRSFVLILREEKTGIEKRLAKELMYAIGPYWSSDAQSVYFYGMDQKMLQNKGYKGGIYKVDINSDNLEQKLLISDYEYTPSEDDALPISGHVVSDDQQYIYMLFQNDWIVKHDLNNGKDTILYRHPKFVRGVLQLSPDGNKLLFAIKNKGEKMSRLLTISTQGGDEKELCTSQESNISESAFWSPDGKYVYFSERPEGTNLWRVDANGGTPEKVWKTNKRAESFAMHPSGEKISYSVRERITEVRVIEGLVNELDKIYSQNE